MPPERLRPLFLILTVVGIVVPYAAFVPFVFEHGLDVALIVEPATTNRISAFAWLDVLVSAVVLLTAAFAGLRTGQAFGVALLTCTVGVSAGLPLFLYHTCARSPHRSVDRPQRIS